MINLGEDTFYSGTSMVDSNKFVPEILWQANVIIKLN